MGIINILKFGKRRGSAARIVYGTLISLSLGGCEGAVGQLVPQSNSGPITLDGFYVNDDFPQPQQKIMLQVDFSCAQSSCPRSSIQYYRSDDPIISSGRIPIINQNLKSLEKGQQVSQLVDINAPSAGIHYYGVCIEDQCSDGIQVEIQGVLFAGSFEVNKTSAVIGENIKLSLSMFCIGGMCMERTVSFHGSYAKDIDADDSLISTSMSSPIRNRKYSTMEIDVKAASSGIYYYGACIRDDCTAGAQVTIYTDEDGDGYGENEDIDDDGDGLIEVSNVTELHNMRWVTDGSGYRTNATAIKKTTGCPTNSGCRGYELVADIDLADVEYHRGPGRYGSLMRWLPIGGLYLNGPRGTITPPFNTIFEGNDFTIRNMTINHIGLKPIGFFTSIGSAAVLRNIHLQDVYVAGFFNVGGLVGEAWEGGSIINVSVQGRVYADDFNAGGIVGSAIARGGRRVHIVSSSMSGDVVSAGSAAGGLIGEGHHATIIDSSVRGKVLAGSGSAGGLVGHGDHTTIIASSVRGSIKGLASVGGLIGKGSGTKITASYAHANISGGDYQYSAAAIAKAALLFPVGYPSINAHFVEFMQAIDYALGINNHIGGLIGYDKAKATISNSYSQGMLSGLNNIGGLIGKGIGSNITTSYARNSIDGHSQTGGLIGDGKEIYTTASYWDSDVNGINDKVDGEYKTTEELKRGADDTNGISIYDGWTHLCPQDDTIEVWNFGTDNQYPIIQCTPDLLE